MINKKRDLYLGNLLESFESNGLTHSPSYKKKEIQLLQITEEIIQKRKDIVANLLNDIDQKVHGVNDISEFVGNDSDSEMPVQINPDEKLISENNIVYDENDNLDTEQEVLPDVDTEEAENNKIPEHIAHIPKFKELTMPLKNIKMLVDEVISVVNKDFDFVYDQKEVLQSQSDEPSNDNVSVKEADSIDEGKQSLLEQIDEQFEEEQDIYKDNDVGDISIRENEDEIKQSAVDEALEEVERYLDKESPIEQAEQLIEDEIEEVHLLDEDLPAIQFESETREDESRDDVSDEVSQEQDDIEVEQAQSTTDEGVDLKADIEELVENTTEAELEEENKISDDLELPEEIADLLNDADDALSDYEEPQDLETEKPSIPEEPEESEVIKEGKQIEEQSPVPQVKAPSKSFPSYIIKSKKIINEIEGILGEKLPNGMLKINFDEVPDEEIAIGQVDAQVLHTEVSQEETVTPSGDIIEEDISENVKESEILRKEEQAKGQIKEKENILADDISGDLSDENLIKAMDAMLDVVPDNSASVSDDNIEEQISEIDDIIDIYNEEEIDEDLADIAKEAEDMFEEITKTIPKPDNKNDLVPNMDVIDDTDDKIIDSKSTGMDIGKLELEPKIRKMPNVRKKEEEPEVVDPGWVSSREKQKQEVEAENAIAMNFTLLYVFSYIAKPLKAITSATKVMEGFFPIVLGFVGIFWLAAGLLYHNQIALLLAGIFIVVAVADVVIKIFKKEESD